MLFRSVTSTSELSEALAVYPFVQQEGIGSVICCFSMSREELLRGFRGTTLNEFVSMAVCVGKTRLPVDWMFTRSLK